MILLIMIVMALITDLIGVHTVLGAFVAGVLIGESPILTEHIDEQLRGLITALFMPVFFGMPGLTADLTILEDPDLLLLAVGLIVIASVGKFAGAFVGGKIGGLTRPRIAGARLRHERARLDRGDRRHRSACRWARSARTCSRMIVAMAVITTMAMPPMLRWALRAAADAQGGEGSGSSARRSTPKASCRISSACCSRSTTARTANSRRASPA